MAFSGKTSVNFDSGSSTTASICLPRTPPAALISSIAINSTSFSETSLMAMVPVSECRMPTLTVFPVDVLLLHPVMNGARADAAARVRLDCPTFVSICRLESLSDAAEGTFSFNFGPS